MFLSKVKLIAKNVFFTLFPTDDLTQVQTYGKSTFDKVRLTLAQDYIIFEVKACKEAIVALTQVPGQVTKDAWVITFGTEDNTKTSVSQKGSSGVSTSYDTKDILHCDEYREFWVRWADSKLDLGQGNSTGENGIAEIQLGDDSNIYPFVIFDTGADAQGSWKFLSDAGRLLFYAGL